LTLGGTLSNVSLATQVTGNLPVTNLNSGTGATSSTYWRGDGTWATVSATLAASLSGGTTGSLPYQSATNVTTFLTGNTTTTPQFVTSTGLAGVATAPTLTGSTGSGNVVLATSPTLVTPALGTPSAINLTNATSLPYAALPTGTILQVVQGTYSTSVSTASSTFSDTGLTSSITPKFSTSKILVLVTLSQCAKTNSDTSMKIRLLRSSTQIAYMADIIGYTNTTTNNIVSSASINYLDSPATTSSTTYKVQFGSQANSASVSIGDSFGGGVGVSTITLMEVAG
jgi:hypothetical protein